jgi:hypothetical protein
VAERVLENLQRHYTSVTKLKNCWKVAAEEDDNDLQKLGLALATSHLSGISNSDVAEDQ